MHYCVDKWLEKYYPLVKMVRYAEDLIVHCRSHEEATQTLTVLKECLTECGLEINPTVMFRSLKNIGLTCSKRSFTRWFNLNFPNYDHKWNRSYAEPLKISKPEPKINFIPLPKILSIYVVNPDYGVSKDTGECSEKR